jgi:hypothetical protein
MSNVCPLCDKPATLLSVDHDNAMKVFCDNCGQYVVTKISVERLDGEFSASKNGIRNKVIEIDEQGGHADIYQEVTGSGKSLGVRALSHEAFKEIR